MKTFDDLVFECIVDLSYGKAYQAYMDFDNGYGISVIYGLGAFCNNNGQNWEVAIMKDGKICYDTPLANNVLEYQTKEDINRIMKVLQNYTSFEDWEK